MKPKIKRKINRIYKYLFFLSTLSIPGLMALYYLSEIGSDIFLSFLGLIFMLVSSFVFFKAIYRSLNSTNKMAFIQIVMVNVFLKMAGILAIVVLYWKIAKPESKMIIIPFMIIYLVFSVVETIFTYKLANKNS